MGIDSLLLTRALNGYSRLGLLLLPVYHYTGRRKIIIFLHLDAISAPVFLRTCFLISCVFSGISIEIFGKSVTVAASLTLRLCTSYGA